MLIIIYSFDSSEIFHWDSAKVIKSDVATYRGDQLGEDYKLRETIILNQNIGRSNRVGKAPRIKWTVNVMFY
jgi:hypothetical protein